MLFLSLVAMKELLARAEEKGVAIGAFSVGNMEMVMGAVKAAEELDRLGHRRALSGGAEDSGGEF